MTPPFSVARRSSFFRRADEVLSAPPQRPGESVDVQLCKLAKGLLSDRYVPTVGEGDGVEDSAAAVAPRMLKAVLGKGHPEFSSTRQQDAHEFYQHVLTMLERHARAAGSNATDLAPLFTFAFEQRTQCEQSGKVRYERRQENTLSLPVPVEEATNKDAVAAYEARRQEAEQQPDQSAAKRARTADAGSSKATGEEPVLPKVPFDACLRAWAAAETVDHFLSPATGQRGRAIRTGRFATFPRYLVIQMKRYVLAEDWSPRKLDVSVSVPDSLDLSAYRGGGLQEGEEELPDGGAAASAAPSVEPDDALVAQLASMGFSTNGCKRACIAVQNAGADAAMAWILEHMEDADFNDPPAAPGAQAAAPAAAADPNSVAMIIAMGFNEEQAKHALGETGGSVERAVDWLFSHNGEIPAAGGAGAGAAGGEDGGEDGEGKYSLAAVISHIGKSPMAGHYVCHIRKGGRWVIYNDRKVRTAWPPFLQARPHPAPLPRWLSPRPRPSTSGTCTSSAATTPRGAPTSSAAFPSRMQPSRTRASRSHGFCSVHFPARNCAERATKEGASGGHGRGDPTKRRPFVIDLVPETLQTLHHTGETPPLLSWPWSEVPSLPFNQGPYNSGHLVGWRPRIARGNKGAGVRGGKRGGSVSPRIA